MGLDDPTKKMSKSAASPNNYISLLDSPDEISRKIKIAVTDSGSEIVYDEEKKPAISNLIAIYSLFSGKSVQALEKEYSGKGYAEFKAELAKVIINALAPISERFRELEQQKDKVLIVLRGGAEDASKVAEATLREVKEKMGFLQR